MLHHTDQLPLTSIHRIDVISSFNICLVETEKMLNVFIIKENTTTIKLQYTCSMLFITRHGSRNFFKKGSQCSNQKCYLVYKTEHLERLI